MEFCVKSLGPIVAVLLLLPLGAHASSPATSGKQASPARTQTPRLGTKRPSSTRRLSTRSTGRATQSMMRISPRVAQQLKIPTIRAMDALSKTLRQYHRARADFIRQGKVLLGRNKWCLAKAYTAAEQLDAGCKATTSISSCQMMLLTRCLGSEPLKFNEKFNNMYAYKHKMIEDLNKEHTALQKQLMNFWKEYHRRNQ